jgi:undecaprenyl-diphosphatase
LGVIEAIYFGILEGICEFLPISSTGHLILLSQFLDIKQDNFHKSFEIIIQLGAILAVVVYFFKDIFRFDVILKLSVAFIPTGIVGFFAYSYIKSLFDVYIVAYMLIFGGIVFILMDIFFKEKKSNIDTMEKISLKKAFFIGCFQVLSMIPGTSRSGATIIGGLFNNLSKSMSAKFSFLLAVPTMFVATIYDVYKNYHIFNGLENISLIIIAFMIAFITAIFSIKIFLQIVKKIGFYIFGVYRIIVGIIILYYI